MESDEQRASLARLASDRKVSLARLSRALGRNPAYVQQYVARGSPRVLPERERRLLADFLGIDEELLGGPAQPRAVARFDVAASAGPGGIAEIDLPEQPRQFDPAMLAALDVRAHAASMIRVAGDSMAPTLLGGDEILVDGDARQVSRGGGVYVLRHEGTVMVKRLRRTSAGIDVLSDNSDAPSLLGLDPAAVTVIGRVVWIGRAL